MSNNNTQEELITLQYSVKPTKTQEQALYSHAGAVRYAYNWTLNHIQTQYETHLKDPEHNPKPSINLPTIRKQWNQDKHNLAPWWRNNK